MPEPKKIVTRYLGDVSTTPECVDCRERFATVQEGTQHVRENVGHTLHYEREIEFTVTFRETEASTDA